MDFERGLSSLEDIFFKNVLLLDNLKFSAKIYLANFFNMLYSTMKNKFRIVLVSLLVSGTLFAVSRLYAQTDNNQIPNNINNSLQSAKPQHKGVKGDHAKLQSNNSIKDLVLIYDGSTHRSPWTKDRIKPYVYRANNGKFDWLFDGYLFLEIFDTKRNIAYDPGFKYNAAAKPDFQSILDTYFSRTTSFGALESVLDSLAKAGKIAQRKRKVVIGIVVPRKDFTEWGSVDNKKLDFNSMNDIATAVQWYIDASLKMWKKANYKHLELGGFYWVSEEAGTYADAIKMTGRYLDKLGYPFYWIPYYNAPGAAKWKENGFKYAYYQPNYFFSLKIPYERLADACSFARKNGLSMEMEFDDNIISDTTFRKRFDDYVKVFTEQHVWDSQVAYYEGGGAWEMMSRSKDAEIKKRFELFGDIIAKRQREADLNK
jgi:hypothetical protein